MKISIHKLCFITTTTALIFSLLLLCTLLIAETSGGGLGKRRQSTAEDDDFAEFDDDDFDEEPGKVQVQGGAGRVDRGGKNQGESKLGVPEAGSKSKDQSSQPSDFDDDDFEDSIEERVQEAEKDPEKPPGESGKESESQKAGFDEDDEVFVEDDDFVGLDDDEFDDDIPSETAGGKKRRGDSAAPKLTITDVPMPMRGWQAYWAELLMLTGIGVYLLNYIIGRYKNQNIAQVFFESNWNILEENFYYLGDGPSANVEDEGTRTFSKMSDSLFQIWCSGRTSCEGMLLELKLLKRQDLVGILSHIFRPIRDVFRFTVEMNKDEMESLVFAIATKKQALKISKEYNDLINYCPEKKPGDKFGLSSQFVVMSEMGEVATAILDQKTSTVINKYASYIESIHFSDQFTGTKSTEPEVTKDGVMKPPEPKKLLIFTFALPINNTGTNIEQAIEEVQPLFQFVFHTVDRFKRVHLSKEGKAKADKNRAKVEEAFLKQTHAARAEAAAARKEEKRRQEKERILQEDDPEKQRRWEEKEQKREKKKKAPKMKQLKVKAM